MTKPGPTINVINKEICLGKFSKILKIFIWYSLSIICSNSLKKNEPKKFFFAEFENFMFNLKTYFSVRSISTLSLAIMVWMWKFEFLITQNWINLIHDQVVKTENSKTDREQKFRARNFTTKKFTFKTILFPILHSDLLLQSKRCVFMSSLLIESLLILKQKLIKF